MRRASASASEKTHNVRAQMRNKNHTTNIQYICCRYAICILIAARETEIFSFVESSCLMMFSTVIMIVIVE